MARVAPGPLPVVEERLREADGGPSRGREAHPEIPVLEAASQRFVEAARALAGRMMREGGTDPAERLAWGFEAVTARRPTSDEHQILLATFTDALNEFRADPARAEALLKTGESPRDASLDPVVHAAYASVARVVLNLSEAVTKE